MSTNLLPAAQLLALADRLFRAAFDSTRYFCGDEEFMAARCSDVRELTKAVEAYRAARQSSPVTLEEQMLIDEFRKPDGILLTATYEHARTLAAKAKEGDS